jgi:hypothetical protein
MNLLVFALIVSFCPFIFFSNVPIVLFIDVFAKLISFSLFYQLSMKSLFLFISIITFGQHFLFFKPEHIHAASLSFSILISNQLLF